MPPLGSDVARPDGLFGQDTWGAETSTARRKFLRTFGTVLHVPGVCVTSVFSAECFPANGTSNALAALCTVRLNAGWDHYWHERHRLRRSALLDPIPTLLRVYAEI